MPNSLPSEKIARKKFVPIKTEANTIQIGGDHYKKLPIEPWDYIASNGLGFFDGNAVKYLTRWKDKGGVKDLEKAIHYIQKLIELEEKNG